METKTRLEGLVEKGWGSEYIFVTNDSYCGKYLHFNKYGRFSMHFHKEKLETWKVLSGEFLLTVIDCKTAVRKTGSLSTGSVFTVLPMTPHSLKCVSEDGGTILEISTPDSVEDNYRIEPGDSQK